MSIFDYTTGIQFRKTGHKVKAAISARIVELHKRLEKRDTELAGVMNNKTLLRSYLVRVKQNDYPHSSQLRAEMPTEEHQRITELCRRIQLIEGEISHLSVVRDNLTDDQELELSFDDLTKVGFSPEHYQTSIA